MTVRETINHPPPLIELPKIGALWGDFADYRHALGLFLRDHQSDSQMLWSAVSAGDLTRAAWIAHKLRGAAGALLLSRVFVLAGVLEDRLKAGHADLAAVNILDTALSQTMVIVADYLAAVADHTPEPPAGRTEINAERLHTLLGDLLRALDTNRADLIEGSLPQLADALSKPCLELLQEHIGAFDYRGAETLVSTWLVDCGSRPPEV